LKKIVDHENDKPENVPIYVPISGFCIPKNIFLYCSRAKEDPEFKRIDSNNDYDVILEFIIHITNTCNAFSLQRERLYLTNYLK